MLLRKSIFFLIIYSSFNLYSSDKCSRFLNPTFLMWEYGIVDPVINPHQLFPGWYIRDLRNQYGAIDINIRFSNKKYYIEAEVPSFGTFARFQMISFNDNAMMIDGVALMNPLNIKNHQLHQNQSKKGMPVNVFRFLKDQVYELVRKSGKNSIVTTGGQDYTVLQLYRKIVGMEPMSPESKLAIEMLDNYYDTARKVFPEKYRVSSLNEFSHQLGNYYSFSGEKEALDAWKDYSKSGKLSESIELLYDKTGIVIAFVFKKASVHKQKIYYINNLLTEKPILTYRDLARGRFLYLKVDL